MSTLGNRSPMKAVTEMRAVIDAFAARYAAMRIRAGADPEPLLQAFEKLQAVARANDYARFIDADRDLHFSIVLLARVDGLDAVWRTIGQHQEPFRMETVRKCWPDLDVLFEAHRPIVDAVCDGDATLAEDAAKAHLDAVWYRLAEHTGDPSLSDDPLARACAYLAFHLHEPIQLQALARHVARTSAGHLARLFREVRGMNFTTYLRELRMQRAADLLRRTGLPIRKVGLNVGYAQASRFTQHFRRRFGMTPTTYRNRMS